MPSPKPKYQAKLRFRIKVAGQEVARFRSASSLESEVENIEEHEMGDPDVADQQPGKRKVTEVTLAQGASDNDYLWLWYQDVYNDDGEGKEDDLLKREVTVEELARNRTTVLRTWVLEKAWPRKFVAGDFDASASENAVRSVTLAFVRLKKRAES
jgi:phage tail-like protein